MDDFMFFYVWAVSVLLILMSSVLLFIFFVKHGRILKDRNRARRLALWADVPGKDDKKKETESRED